MMPSITENRDLVGQLLVKMAPPLGTPRPRARPVMRWVGWLAVLKPASRSAAARFCAATVTLLSSEPEVQYVALRNIELILRKYPTILSQDIRVFFCKYNDPPYVKLEKLEIIVRLTNEKNVEYVLAELKEYATEVDVEFVRRAVLAIGRVAVKLERATERCISSLLDLIKTKVNYVVETAIVVIKVRPARSSLGSSVWATGFDALGEPSLLRFPPHRQDIFRRFPNTYESLIPVLTESLESLDEPNAKGRAADRIAVRNAGRRCSHCRTCVVHGAAAARSVDDLDHWRVRRPDRQRRGAAGAADDDL